MTVEEAGSEKRVARVALLSSRVMYWTVRPIYETAVQHAEGLVRLLEWAINLPGARIGVDPKGIGLIIRSLYSCASKEPRVRIDRWLDRVGATEGEFIPFPKDPQLFGPYIHRLFHYLRRAQQNPKEYLWLEDEDARWWLEQTRNAFQEYTKLFHSSPRDESPLLSLFIRHRCTVFAPWNSQATLGSLHRLLPFGEQQGQRALKMLQYHGLHTSVDLTERCPLYWSWRLIDFGVAGRDLIWQPMLALWSDWPSSPRWAPPRPEDCACPPPLSPESAADLLEDVLWKKLEIVFAIARQACGLGVAEPEFAGVETRPPLFYFAAPENPPARPEQYPEEYREILYPIVSRCLASDDPFSREVAWGVLEGDLVALRREYAGARYTQAWYLLLPLLGRSGAEQNAEIERDLEFVADRLTFLEFTIGHKARDVATDLEETSTRQALWGGTLDSVSEQVREGASLFPLLKPSDRQKINRELQELLGMLHRWRALVEKISSDAAQILRKYRGYQDGTEDFIRRRLTFSFPFAPFLLSLRDALLDAYPYHYLQRPLQGLENMMKTLSENMTNITRTLSAFLNEAERETRERQEQATRWLGFVLSLLALLIGVPSLIPGAQITSENYPSWMGRFLPLRVLEQATRVLAVVLVVLLLGTVAWFIFEQIRSLFPSPDPFLARLRKLWELVEEARRWVTEKASDQVSRSDFGALERLDESACILLIGLWKELQREEGKSLHPRWWRSRIEREADRWLRNTRHLRYLIELFDLRPEVIPLPRALCVFRYKSTDFHDRAVISDWEFNRSLRLAGFSSEEVRELHGWLSGFPNQHVIEDVDVKTFVEILQHRGVSADPAKRTPKHWKGLFSKQFSE
ncbi:hypothetical protein [Thermoflexus hugenholtzii]